MPTGETEKNRKRQEQEQEQMMNGRQQQQQHQQQQQQWDSILKATKMVASQKYGMFNQLSQEPK